MTPKDYEPARCPMCNRKLIDVIYGLPGPELIEAEDRGEVILRGCVMPPNPPHYLCKRCGREYGGELNRVDFFSDVPVPEGYRVPYSPPNPSPIAPLSDTPGGAAVTGPIRAHLGSWAAGRGIALNSVSRTLALDDNLYVPLSRASYREFAEGDGAELGKPGKPGKMHSLHSSSALAVNVFEFWRGRDRAPLAAALELADEITGVRFEQKFRTGLPGTGPNLDVVLDLASGALIAIESKFLEPFGGHVPGFRWSYFADRNDGEWARGGYPACQALAQRLEWGETRYTWLHAEQLLKHILGLHRSAGKPWSLLYLYYGVDGPAGAEHTAEVAEFARVVAADGISFRAMTYQELVRGLRAAGADEEYRTWLKERYEL